MIKFRNVFGIEKAFWKNKLEAVEHLSIYIEELIRAVLWCTNKKKSFAVVQFFWTYENLSALINKHL